MKSGISLNVGNDQSVSFYLMNKDWNDIFNNDPSDKKYKYKERITFTSGKI